MSGRYKHRCDYGLPYNQYGFVISMENEKLVNESETLALRALSWIVSDDALGPRFLDITGIAIDDLRSRAGSRDVLVATLGFLTSHEPSLLAAAQALEIKPGAIMLAAQRLGA